MCEEFGGAGVPPSQKGGGSCGRVVANDGNGSSMMSGNSLSICLVAHNAYGVLAGVDTGHMGGIEVQTPLMAKWLAAEGFRVSMITWDEGEEYEHEEGTVIDGVTVYKLCRRQDGLPVVRFVHPRWTSLWAALNRADADIVYYNCGDLGLGQVVHWARVRGRKVLYSVANDVDCVQSLPGLEPLRERVIYKYGIKRADRIVAQTRTQQKLLNEEFGRSSRVVPMPSRGFVEEGTMAGVREKGDRLRILWVGRLTKPKRLEWLLDLAERCPDADFDVLGAANTESEYAKAVVGRAGAISNVFLRGRVLHTEMGGFYRKADLLCSTSIYEGFPNVYLEAWSLGIPLVTTFDPDDVVKTHGHGRVATDVDGLEAAVSELSEPGAWREASDAARSYFLQFHQVEVAMVAFKEEFLALGAGDC